MSTAQRRRRSQFRSLFGDDKDGKEMHTDQQCHFIVSYLGETDWRDEFMYVDEILENVLPVPKQTSGKFWLKKEPRKKVCLAIDISSTSVFIQNTEGISENCFKFCNIKEVIYCGNMKQYSKYIILVVNGELDSSVKAHIFSCGSVKEAKNAFKTFTDMFAHVSHENPDLNAQVETDMTDVFCDEITSSPHLPLETANTENSLSESEQSSPEVEEHDVDNAFTAFARSRSFNFGKRYVPGTRTNILRPYSLPVGGQMQPVTGN
jgi:hypothetical protein